MKPDYYQEPASVQEYIRMAAGVSGVELIEKLRPFLTANATLLEIGSGPGTDWKILSGYYQVTGSDNSKPFLDHLRSSCPQGTFLDLDAVTLPTTQRFDGIYSNKVLHHLTDHELDSSLQRQHAVLNDKGIVCHSFWKGEGSEDFKGMLVNYQSRNSLSKLFEGSFEMLLLEDYKEFETDDSLLLIAQKRI